MNDIIEDAAKAILIALALSSFGLLAWTVTL
jgi:hypothetical protein